MAERQVTASNLPVVTPPWLQNTASPTQNPGQQTSQPQNASIPKADTDYLGLAGKLFGKTAFKAVKPFFAAGGAATGIGGAATGGVTAGGGSYVTGSGLAGSASAINTTAGAAGTANTGSFTNGLNGLASAGIGLATVAIGENYFGGYGGTGAAIGSAIGSLWGPVGSAVGGMLGGAVGGAFGGDTKRAFVSINQGGATYTPLGKRQQTFNTDLGPVVIGVTNIPGDVSKTIGDVIKKSDAQVAKLFSEDQLERVKQGLKYGPASNPHVDWGQPENSDRVEGVLKTAFKDRYALAVGGLDTHYYGTFQRVADDKNMAGLIAAMAKMDSDIKNKQGEFADFAPQQAAVIDGKDPRLNPTITTKELISGGWGKTKDRVTANPQYDPALAQAYQQQQASRKAIGYEQYERTEKVVNMGNPTATTQIKDYRPIHEDAPTAIGNQAIEHLAETYGISNKPALPRLKVVPTPQYIAGFGASQNSMAVRVEQENKAALANYNKQLAAWEKKVLDTYANKNLQTTGADNLTSNTITRETTVQAEQPAARTQLFGDIQQQEVKLNRAAPQNNNATNAGLLQRGGLI